MCVISKTTAYRKKCRDNSTVREGIAFDRKKVRELRFFSNSFRPYASIPQTHARCTFYKYIFDVYNVYLCLLDYPAHNSIIFIERSDCDCCDRNDIIHL